MKMEHWNEIDRQRFELELETFCSQHNFIRSEVLPDSMTLMEALRTIYRCKKAQLFGGSAQGVVSDRDILRAILAQENLEERPLSTLKSAKLWKLKKGAKVLDGLLFLRGHHFRHVVFETSEGDHILSIRELLEFFIDQFTTELGAHQVNMGEDIMLNIQEEDFSLSQEARDPSKFRGCLFLNPLSRLLSRTPLKVTQDLPIVNVLQAIISGHHEAALVFEFETMLKGIITERDLVRAYLDQGQNFYKLKASEVMSPEPHYLSFKHNLAHALNLMHEYGHRQIVITDEDRVPLGVVSLLEILSFIARFLPEE